MTHTAVPAPIRRAVPRPVAERYVGLVIVLVGGAVLVTGYLTVALWRQVDPVTEPVSDYAFYGSGGPLFVLAVLLLLGSGLALITGMASARVPSGGSAAVLFGLWCAGLLLCAVFPANEVAGHPTTSGEIHRLGGAVFLTCLPAAAMRLARSFRSDPRWRPSAARVRRLATVAVVATAAFGLSQVVAWLPLGLLERVALGAEVALVIVLAFDLRKAAR